MLTTLLVGSESFMLCWCLSPKLALNETLHWLCSGRLKECKQASLRGGLPLLPHPICRSPKAWSHLCADSDGTEREAESFYTHHKYETEKNWKKLGKKILYFQQQRNRAGKILKGVCCAWSIYRNAPLKSLNSSDLFVLPRIFRQELPPHAPQGGNRLLIESENVTEMW